MGVAKLSLLKRGLAALALGAMAAGPAGAADQGEALLQRDWPAIVEAAAGQEVFFHAWGGDDRINSYIAWAGDRLAESYNVTLRHVKVDGIASSVSTVLAEKQAGQHTGGSIDLMWINGENFAEMKKNDLLFGPFTDKLPSFAYVDPAEKPTTVVDFTLPTDGYESPWGMAQLVFMYDTARIDTPPKSMEELLAFAKEHPGRVSYPEPPFFLGTTFLKQALIELTEDAEALQAPVAEADFDAVTAPLWSYLDKLHPHMWRKANAFPESGPEMRRMLGDGELAIAFAFNPAAASNAIANGVLPRSVRTYVHEDGTLANSHYVAIPYNASAKAGALVAANFLLSPEAQARKANPEVWGDPTVLSMDKLPEDARERFADLPRGPATLPPAERGEPLLEPHPSWVAALEEAWQARYVN